MFAFEQYHIGFRADLISVIFQCMDMRPKNHTKLDVTIASNNLCLAMAELVFDSTYIHTSS